MTKHITRGVLTGIPAAVLAAALSNKGSRLRNALLYGGLTTAAATGISALTDKHEQKSTPSNSLTKAEEQIATDISANKQRQKKNEIKYPVNNAKIADDTIQNPTATAKPEDQKPRKLFTAAQRLKELRAEGVENGSRSSLVNTWRGVFSKDDYGLKRTGPIQYTKFLGNLIGESFGKAWYSTTKAVDKALAAAEETERKNQEALAGLKPSSVGFGLVPQARAATVINDVTAAALNPNNPEEYRQALRNGTARTQLYEQFIKDTGHNVDTIGKLDLGMSDGNLRVARIGSDMLINMTADPYTALTMGVGTPIAKVLRSSIGTRTLADAIRYRRLIKMRNAGIRPKGFPKWLKRTKNAVTGLGIEAGSEVLEDYTLPHYDIAKGGRVSDAITMFNRINERRAQLGKQPLDESYLELIYDNTSETPVVNLQNRLKLRMGEDYLGLINK